MKRDHKGKMEAAWKPATDRIHILWPVNDQHEPTKRKVSYPLSFSFYFLIYDCLTAYLHLSFIAF